MMMRLPQLGILLCLPLFAKIDPVDWSMAKTSNEAESLFLRRIADFWQEGEFGIAKNQMEEFLNSYPESQFADPLRVCLGDILLREKNFSKALESYSALSSPDFSDKTFLNRMQCLYSLEWYSTLADECEEFLKKSLDDETALKTTFYLAIALYHQCLNASKDQENLLKLAKRAEPHFETLLQSELSTEVAQAFAHLCCILKDYKKAAGIYLELAGKEPDAEEEMEFQAALIQAEYDKTLAIQSFERIVKNGQKRAKEAAYNHLVLSFNMGRYEEIVQNKESILMSIPEGRMGLARFYLGRSLLSMKNYSEAIGELTIFIKEIPAASTELIRSGLLSLIEAAHLSSDVETLDSALSKLSEINPSDAQVAKGRLLRSMLFKNTGRIEEAQQELEKLLLEFPDFSERAAAFFEWADLEYQAGHWEECRARSLAFLEQFPTHEMAPYAWRYLATASSRLSNETSVGKEVFAKDLEALLKQKELFPDEELCDWKFYLSRIYFDLDRFEDATNLLESLLKEHPSFSQEANAYLLLGLCYRNWKGDNTAFCEWAEKAILKKSDLIAPGFLHVSLFNAYLELSKEVPELVDKSAEHLYEAFSARADISRDNLLWLGDWYFSKQDSLRASNVFSFVLQAGFDETAAYKLGNLHASMGLTADQISTLESLVSAYASDPLGDWKWERESRLLLAEGYQKIGLENQALSLLNEVANGNPATLSETIAKAYLAKARILKARLSNKSMDEKELAEAASLFKDLILQRRLEHEPIHLEAALDYVSLLENTGPNHIEKRLALLEKIKKDFENNEDLLSKDYHQARLKYPAKNRIFEDYMRFINEEILMAKSDLATDVDIQKELQAKAKDLLLQIKSECDQPTLLKRVSSRLQDTDVPVLE